MKFHALNFSCLRFPDNTLQPAGTSVVREWFQNRCVPAACAAPVDALAGNRAIGITIIKVFIKVFIYDTSALQRGYRILAFMILGVILRAISFAYQKDLLGLQKSREREI